MLGSPHFNAESFLMKTSSLCLGLALALAATCVHAQPPTAMDHPAGHAQPANAALTAAVAGAWRDPANVARDRYRNPAQTLAFLDLQPGDTVIEITPGGGWYTEILAPYLREEGQYIAAVVDPASAEEGGARDNQQRSKGRLEQKLAGSAGTYGDARVVGFDPAAPMFGPAGSADAVVTFRNVHNWRMNGQAEGMFEGFFAVLKPGGVLGVVEHRAAADVPVEDKSGYVGQDQVIAMAKAAGFALDASSEVNANPRDTKDHPNGVWTLPPVGRHDEADAARYQAIGESDRMTLRFVKPAQ